MIRLDPGELAFARALMSVAESRKPDELIPPDEAASTYMRRWYLRRDRQGGNRYLHQILRSDDDRALHDHPWDSISLILEGMYIEHTLEGEFTRLTGQVIARRAGDRHRIALIDEAPCWTLFITGPKIREWGFWCPQGFIHNADYDDAIGCGA